MHPRISELLDHIDQRRASLLAAVNDVPADKRDQSPAEGKWSAAQVITHLAKVERGTTALLRSRISNPDAPPIAPETETSSVISLDTGAKLTNRANRLDAPERALPLDPPPIADALVQLNETRRALRESLMAGDGLALGTVTHEHPRFGTLNLYEWVAFLGWHEERHAEQVREIARGLREA